MLCSLEAAGAWLYCHPKSWGLAVLSPTPLGSYLLPFFLAHPLLLQTVEFSLMILAHQMSWLSSQGTCNVLHNRTTAWLCLEVSCPWSHSHARCQSLESSTEITISAGATCSYPHGRDAMYQFLAARTLSAEPEERAGVPTKGNSNSSLSVLGL